MQKIQLLINLADKLDRSGQHSFADRIDRVARSLHKMGLTCEADDDERWGYQPINPHRVSETRDYVDYLETKWLPANARIVSDNSKIHEQAPGGGHKVPDEIYAGHIKSMSTDVVGWLKDYRTKLEQNNAALQKQIDGLKEKQEVLKKGMKGTAKEQKAALQEEAKAISAQIRMLKSEIGQALPKINFAKKRQDNLFSIIESRSGVREKFSRLVASLFGSLSHDSSQKFPSSHVTPGPTPENESGERNRPSPRIIPGAPPVPSSGL